MKSILILILSFATVHGYSSISIDTIPRGEFYPITEAYLIEGDSIYTMKEEFVDVPSEVFILFTRSSSPDSSVVISIDHGNDKVIYLGYAEEIEAPGDFDFLPGKKSYYYWRYITHNMKEPGGCYVIREFVTETGDMVSLEYFRFHFIFEKYKIMFYCQTPQITF